MDLAAFLLGFCFSFCCCFGLVRFVYCRNFPNITNSDVHCSSQTVRVSHWPWYTLLSCKPGYNRHIRVLGGDMSFLKGHKGTEAQTFLRRER